MKAKTAKPDRSEPTTFELAQLAAMLMARAPKAHDHRHFVSKAYDLWHDAEFTIHRSHDHLCKMAKGVFTMTESEWIEMRDAYGGAERDFRRMLQAPVSRKAALKKLFVAKNETNETRLEKLSILLDFVRETKLLDDPDIQDLFHWATSKEMFDRAKVEEFSLNGNLLKIQDTWRINVCRLLAVARMRQIAKSKRRA